MLWNASGAGKDFLKSAIKDFSFDSGRRIESGRRCEAVTGVYFKGISQV